MAQPEDAQQQPDEKLHRGNNRAQQSDNDPHRQGQGERGAIGARDRNRFGKHFRENQDHGCHGQRDDRDRPFRKHRAERLRRQHRRQNIHKGVAEQKCPDQPFAVGNQMIDLLRGAGAFTGQMVHARLGNRGQRCLRTGKKSREKKQGNDCEHVQRQIKDHCQISRSSPARHR